MRAIGVDLAWSEPGAPSGLVTLDDQGRVAASAYLAELAAISGFCLAQASHAPVAIGVDAPLRVTNETGQRRAERELQQLFGPRRLGAHVANRRRLEAVHGAIRGEQLVASLGPRVTPDPWRLVGTGNPPGPGEGVVVEVYPHAAIVAWFDLPAPLRYKHGTLAERREGLRMLLGLLDGLQRADPPLLLASAPWYVEPEGLQQAGTRVLDHLESMIDATICAHVARYWARWGTARCRVLGDAEEGQLVVPLPVGVPGGSGIEADDPVGSQPVQSERT